MSKLQKILAGIIAVCVVFFGFVVVRIVAAPNDTSVKLAKIPQDKQLGKEAYKEAYPLEYNSFMKNNDTSPSPTGYGGAQAENSHLTEQPEMVENFKGYKFALQYDDDRGHTYAGEDFKNTKRLPGQKGNCITCKSSYMYDVYYKQSGWDYASKPIDEVMAPIEDDQWFGCSTCHDPETMELRVYQQGFIDSMARRGIDVNNASHNDKRAYVCAQCHNEYYFTKEDGRVNHPFDNGLDAESEYEFYQSGQAGAFKQDWIHADSKAPMLKAQHPDFETWATSVHADAGVTCVDCHMPYMRENGQKYTSHWMTNPLKTRKSRASSATTRALRRSRRASRRSATTPSSSSASLARRLHRPTRPSRPPWMPVRRMNSSKSRVSSSAKRSGTGIGSPLKMAWASTIRTRSCARSASPSTRHISASRRRTPS